MLGKDHHKISSLTWLLFIHSIIFIEYMMTDKGEDTTKMKKAKVHFTGHYN
jgi:hypothetical protein